MIHCFGLWHIFIYPWGLQDGTQIKTPNPLLAYPCSFTYWRESQIFSVCLNFGCYFSHVAKWRIAYCRSTMSALRGKFWILQHFRDEFGNHEYSICMKNITDLLFFYVLTLSKWGLDGHDAGKWRQKWWICRSLTIASGVQTQAVRGHIWAGLAECAGSCLTESGTMGCQGRSQTYNSAPRVILPATRDECVLLWGNAFFLPTLHFPFWTVGLGSRECGILPISVCIFHVRLWLYNSILNCHMIYLRCWGCCLHLFICKEKDAHNSLFI